MPAAGTVTRRRHEHPPRRLALVAGRKDEPVGELTDEGREWLHDLDDDYVSCRGGRHKWPDWDLRKKTRPRGVHYFAQRDGRVVETETCGRCGKQRWRLSLVGGYADPHAQWRYEDPKGFKSPRGSGVDRAACRAEMYRRRDEGPVGEMMRTLAEAAMSAEEESLAG